MKKVLLLVFILVMIPVSVFAEDKGEIKLIDKIASILHSENSDEAQEIFSTLYSDATYVEVDNYEEHVCTYVDVDRAYVNDVLINKLNMHYDSDYPEDNRVSFTILLGYGEEFGDSQLFVDIMNWFRVNIGQASKAVDYKRFMNRLGNPILNWIDEARNISALLLFQNADSEGIKCPEITINFLQGKRNYYIYTADEIMKEYLDDK